jgi:hypothetical protein
VIRKAAIVCVGILLAGSSRADPTEPKPGRHSLSEFDFLIGRWTCTVTAGDKPLGKASAQYEWIYNGKVLKETLEAPGYSGTFLTTYDPRTDSFKGVGVGNDGSYVVWQNGGIDGNKSSEKGYLFDADKLIPASRTEFEKVTNNHYLIRDFKPDTASGPGEPTDTEDCTRTS